MIVGPLDVSGVEVTIGGQSASVASAKLVSPGLFQINAIVPDVDGGNQPLAPRADGVISPPGVVVPIYR